MSKAPDDWLRLEAPDGWTLHLRELRPPSGRPELGAVILGHAMMVDGRTMVREDRPTLADAIVDAGFRVWVPDLRGHGRSGPLAPEGRWSFDELVADVGVYVDALAREAPGLPLFLVGHSLFASASLAWLSRAAAEAREVPVSAFVMIASDVWNLTRERSLARRLEKLAVYNASAAIVRALGYFPARRMRQGSTDESDAYWLQARGWMQHGVWDSRDGAIDYAQGLAKLPQPLLHLLSRGDRLYAHPDSAAGLTAAVPRRELVVLGSRNAPLELAGTAPDHMQMVTEAGPGQLRIWAWVARWLAEKARAAS